MNLVKRALAPILDRVRPQAAESAPLHPALDILRGRVTDHARVPGCEAP